MNKNAATKLELSRSTLERLMEVHQKQTSSVPPWIHNENLKRRYRLLYFRRTFTSFAPRRGFILVYPTVHQREK